MSMTILGLNKLGKSRGFGLDEPLAAVPGIIAQSRYGTQDVRITVRGFGARGAGERSNAGTTRGIRIMTDGFPETEPDGRTSLDLIDIGAASHIDVLRSNSTAIWGNAAGGVINVITDDDGPDFLSAQSTFGSYGFRRERISGAQPLGDGRLTFSLSNTNFDGWRAHSGSSQAQASAGIRSKLGEKTLLGIHMVGASNLFRIPGPLTQAQYDADPSQAQGDTASYNPTYLKRDERRFNRLGRLGVSVDHEFDAENSISATAFINPKYLQRSERNTFRDFNRYHVGGSAMYTRSMNILPTLKNVVNAGMDEAYQDGAILFYNLVDGHRGTTLKDNKREGANTFGAFIQDQMNIGKHWVINLGVRHDRITYFAESFIDPSTNEVKTFSAWTPKAGIAYTFSPEHSIYASLGGGVEVPAGNETDPASTFGADTVYSINPLLDPMRSTSIEIGTKQIISMQNNGFLRSVAYDLALYMVEVRDDIIPYSGGKFYFTAGKTRRMGVELGGDAQFACGLNLQCAMSYSDNKYVDYLIDSVHYKKPGAYLDLKDNKMAGVPDMMYYVRVKWAPPVLSGLFAEVSMRGCGKYFADDRNTLDVPSYTVINAAIGVDNFAIIRDKLLVSAFAGINNLTDVKYAESAFINPDRGKWNNEAIYLEPGLPMNWMGSLTIKWQM
jgi:iron complex outermembrane receptor protein